MAKKNTPIEFKGDMIARGLGLSEEQGNIIANAMSIIAGIDYATLMKGINLSDFVDCKDFIQDTLKITKAVEKNVKSQTAIFLKEHLATCDQEIIGDVMLARTTGKSTVSIDYDNLTAADIDTMAMWSKSQLEAGKKASLKVGSEVACRAYAEEHKRPLPIVEITNMEETISRISDPEI